MEPQTNKRRLERTIALILASILASAFFVYVERISIIVERESVRQCLSSLRVGIQMFMLTDLVRGEGTDMRAYENDNPMRFQENPPPNYAGELGVEEAAKLPGGQWYYDKSVGQLVYRVIHYPLFENDDRRELRYSLQFSNIAGGVSRLHLIEVKAGT